VCADVLRTKDDFWATLPVKQVVVVMVGEFEVFRDDVITMAKKRCGAGIGDRLTLEALPG
jgi:hypothetical protein